MSAHWCIAGAMIVVILTASVLAGKLGLPKIIWQARKSRKT